MFLDLCLGTECFNRARSYQQANNITSLDFITFLELYTKLCGLLTNATTASKEAFQSGKDPFWVPRSDGMWMEVSMLKNHNNTIYVEVDIDTIYVVAEDVMLLFFNCIQHFI